MDSINKLIEWWKTLSSITRWTIGIVGYFATTLISNLFSGFNLIIQLIITIIFALIIFSGITLYNKKFPWSKDLVEKSFKKYLDDFRYINMFESIYIILRLDQMEQTGGFSRSDAYSSAKIEHEEEYPRERILEGGLSQTAFIYEALRTFWKDDNSFFQKHYIKKILNYVIDRHDELSGGFGLKVFGSGWAPINIPTLRHTACALIILSFRSVSL